MPLSASPNPGPRASAGPRAGAAGGAARRDPDADNFYQLLGVPYTAGAAEITRAYRAAMKRVHPDRQQGAARRAAAEEQAKALNRAYATLSKPPKRQAYDRTIRAQVLQDQLMNRYVGGFGPSPATAQATNGRHLRRPPTAAERRARARADRNALLSLVVVFGGVTLAVVALILLWSLAGSLLGAVFS
jgi:DnaJ-class molecular chaperone